MEDKNTNVTKKTAKAKNIKIIIALFIAAFIIASCMDLWGEKILPASNSTAISEKSNESFIIKLRNKRIDSIIANVRKAKNSIYTDEDISSAVKVVKDLFKVKDENISLSKITFDEKEMEKYFESENIAENEKSNRMVLICSYYVYKDAGNYSKGYTDNWNVFLERDGASWIIVDQGYF